MDRKTGKQNRIGCQEYLCQETRPRRVCQPYAEKTNRLCDHRIVSDAGDQRLFLHYDSENIQGSQNDMIFDACSTSLVYIITV